MERDDHSVMSIRHRHDFIGMNEDDFNAIKGLRNTLVNALPDALDALYEKIRKTPELKRFFSSESKINQAKKAQTLHWQALLDAHFDGSYVKQVRRIGEVHAHIGLTPRWYIGGYTIILERLIHSIIEDRKDGIGFFSQASGRERLAKNVTSLCKAVLTEIDLTVSYYLDAMETERAELRAEQERRAQEDRSVISSINAALTSLADGDLSYRVTGIFPERSELLKQYFNGSAEQLSKSIGRISISTKDVMTNAESIHHGADNLSLATEQQAAAQEEMSAAVTQIALSASETAKETMKAQRMASLAQSEAEQASKITADAIEAINRMEQSSKEIDNIIGLINNISMQTNILSLNAGVEAARAGEFGRGFAVVASEIRALAERSAKASKEIAALITKAAADVISGATQVHNAREALERITSQVIAINEATTKIATETQSQSAGLNEVKVAIRSLEKTTLENAAIAEESANTAQRLVIMSNELSDDVSIFKIDSASRAER